MESVYYFEVRVLDKACNILKPLIGEFYIEFFKDYITFNSWDITNGSCTRTTIFSNKYSSNNPEKNSINYPINLKTLDSVVSNLKVSNIKLHIKDNLYLIDAYNNVLTLFPSTMKFETFSLPTSFVSRIYLDNSILLLKNQTKFLSNFKIHFDTKNKKVVISSISKDLLVDTKFNYKGFHNNYSFLISVIYVSYIIKCFGKTCNPLVYFMASKTENKFYLKHEVEVDKTIIESYFELKIDY